MMVLCMLCAFTNPKKEIKLAYTYKVGNTYEWYQNTTQTITQEVPGVGEMVIKTSINGTLQLKIAELTPDGAKIETMYTSIRSSIKMPPPMSDVIMDSQSSDDTPTNKLIRTMVNKPFYIYMNKLGVIEKVEGAEKLYEGIGSLGLDEAAAAQAKQSMQQAMSEQSIKASLEMSLIQYPDRKVKTLDTWTSSINTAMNFPIKINNTWTYEKQEGDLLFFYATGNVETIDKEKVITVNGFQARIDLNGRQDTKSKADRKSGWPAEIKILSDIKGKMTLVAGGMIPQDMDIPMTIKSESTFTITKK